MGVVAHGAPVFRIGGDPGGISTRAAVMMERANEFADIHAGLSSLTSDGWQGRAADHFRYKFNLQIKGWLDAQIAFSDASTAYQSYASTLLSAQSQCDEIRSRWEQGRNAVEQAQNNKADARSRSQAAAEGGTPAFDASCDEGPGRSTMAAAEADFQSLVNQVNESGTLLINALNSGISKLPERTWMDSVARTFKSVYDGFVEATIDLVKLVWFIGGQAALYDIGRVICGYMTPEELVTKWVELPVETVAGLFKVLSEKPGAFFEGLAKGIFDYDTFIDDPGRWVGHALPDILITIATAGAGGGASAGSKAATGASRASRIGRALFKELTHIADLEDIANLSKLAFNKLKKVGIDAVTNLSTIAENAAERLRRLKEAGHTGHPPLFSSTDNTPSVPSSGAPSSPSHGGPSSPSYSPPNYPGYNSGGTPNLSGTPAPSHGNGGYSGNASHGGAGAADPNSRFAPPGQQSNGMSGAAHSGDAGTTDPTSKYAPPTHQQNGTPGTAQPGTTPQASGAGTSGAATPAAGSHGTSGTASAGAGTPAPAAGAHGNPSGPAHNGMAGEGVSAADGLPPRRNIDPDEPRNASSNDFHSSANRGESYDAGNRKDSNHLNVDSRDFDKSSNGQYSQSNNTGAPQRGGVGTDELVGAGVGRSEARLGSQGSYEHAGAFGGSDPSRVSHGADGFGGTADFGASAGRGTHGANGVTNSTDTSGGLGSTPSSSHSTGSFTGHGGGHTGADSGTHGGSSTPAQGSYPAAGNPHVPSHADSGSGAGHSGSHQAGQGANGHSGASSSHDAPNTGSGAPKSEPPIPAPPKDNDPIPAPPKDNDPTPAPPKSEAPSSHSLSDTAHAPHTGADNAAGMQHADQSLGSANKADAPSTAMDEADLPTREIDGNAVRRRAGATAGNPDDFSWENNIANKSGKADNAGMPQHTSDPTVGADTHHAPHTGADGAADMSHAGHGDTGGHTADGKPHAADPTTPTHEADGATDAPATKNKFDELLGNPNTHGTTHAPNGTPQAADPTTPAHTADGSADVSTGNKYKDNYGSAEPDGSGHTTNPEGDLKKNPHHDTLNGNESPHSHHSADGDPKDTEIPTGDHSSNDKADNANSEHHANTTETEKPTSDSSHKDDNSTHNDGEEHSKDTQDKHSNKDDTETFEPDKDSADGAHDLTWDDIGGEHTDTDTLYERLYKEYGHKYSDEHARLSTEDWHNIEQAPPVYEVEERLAWATDLHKKHNLDIDGILLTNDYTAPKYEQINGALRDPDAVLSPEELVEISKRDDFLTTVPQFEGTVFRGFKMDEGKLVEILESGTFSDPAYLSTSRWDHVAESFMWKNALGKGEVRAMYEIRGASGADIGPVSFARHEGEVLMGRNSDYKIVSYEKYTDPIKNEPVYHVILEPKE